MSSYWLNNQQKFLPKETGTELVAYLNCNLIMNYTKLQNCVVGIRSNVLCGLSICLPTIYYPLRIMWRTRTSPESTECSTWLRSANTATTTTTTKWNFPQIFNAAVFDLRLCLCPQAPRNAKGIPLRTVMQPPFHVWTDLAFYYGNKSDTLKSARNQEYYP